MDEIVVLLENGCYLALWFSGNPAATEGCDACIGYSLYSPEKYEIDGGEMDYNEYDAGYESIMDAISDVIEFATDELLEYETVSLTREDFEEM